MTATPNLMKTHHPDKVIGESQKRMILEYLLTGAYLTPGEAWNMFGCSKLATRISELIHEDEWPIKSREIKVHSERFGKKRVKQYSLFPFEDTL